MRNTTFAGLADTRRVFPSADHVGRFTVFSIGGNKARLIAAVHYNRGKVDTIGHRVYFEQVAGWGKVLDAILRATSDANTRFVDLYALLMALGFEERVRRDHHIFSKSDIAELINLQPAGSKAKPYQV